MSSLSNLLIRGLIPSTSEERAAAVERFTKDATVAGLSEAHQNLVVALSKRHGSCFVSKEKHGWHANFASPAALERDGTVELSKRHLAVNLDKALNAGMWAARANKRGSHLCGRCMKYEVPYSIASLLQMKPINERAKEFEHIKLDRVGSVRTNESWSYSDGNGGFYPHPPGMLCDLRDPCAAPGLEYLTRRGYDIDVLVDMFSAAWCWQEREEDPSVRRFYAQRGLGFRVTGQGRIILHSYIDGKLRYWQARIPELIFSDERGMEFKAYFHPYHQRYETCEYKDPEKKKFVAIPELDSTNYKWDMPKYWNTPGLPRSDVLFGVDAALRWNHQFNPGRPAVAVLMEGALDAGKIRPPAISHQGKHMSDSQASVLRARFGSFIYVRDNDVAGETAAKSVMTSLGPDTRCISIPPNWTNAAGAPIKDPGDLDSTHQVPYFRTQILGLPV